MYLSISLQWIFYKGILYKIFSMSCNQVVLELSHDVGNTKPGRTVTVIEKLRVKGAPAPRNTPSSPLLSRSSRMIPSTVIALDKSYEIVLKHSNKQLIEAANTVAVRRVDFLSRLQQANHGMTSMDSPFSTSEIGLTEEKPSFVLCGQPVNGFTTKTIDKYLKDQRVGNYKTSAHEVSRVKQQNKVSKAMSEPITKSAGRDKSVNFDEKVLIKDNQSVKSNNFNMPTTTPVSSILNSRHGANTSSFELTGKNFKSVSSADWEMMETVDFKRLMHDKNSRNEMSRSASSPLKAFLRVNNNERARSKDSDDNTRNFSLPNSFSTKGIKKFNNPYRLLKSTKRQILLHQKDTTDHEKIRKITSPPRSAPIHSKNVDIPKPILRVPNPCSDTFLLQMMLDSNAISSKKHMSSKYSDIAVHRDLEEFILVRSNSAQSKGISPVPKSHRSAKSLLNGVEEESVWAGNEVQEETIGKINMKS